MAKKKAKFGIFDLLSLAMVIVVAGIGIAFGLQVMGDTRDSFVTNVAGCNSTDVSGCGADYNATLDAIEGTATFSDKLPIIALVVVAAILIGVLVKNLAGSMGGGN